MLVAFTGPEGQLQTLNLNSSPTLFLNLVNNLIQYNPAKYMKIELRGCEKIKGLNAKSLFFPTTRFEQIKTLDYDSSYGYARMAKVILRFLQTHYFSSRKYVPFFLEDMYIMGQYVQNNQVQTKKFINFFNMNRSYISFIFIPKELVKNFENKRGLNLSNPDKYPMAIIRFKNPIFSSMTEIEAMKQLNNVVVAEDDLCELDKDRYFIAKFKSGKKGLLLSDDLSDLTDQKLLNQINKALTTETYKSVKDDFKKVVSLEEIELPKYVELSKHSEFTYRI